MMVINVGTVFTLTVLAASGNLCMVVCDWKRTQAPRVADPPGSGL
jgi:hypothetical protein